MHTQHLVDVAMGRQPADLVIRGGRWVCVQTGEIIDATDVAIAGDRFAYVGSNADHCVGDQTQLIEADGRYLVPGLLDGHMHVESGMITISEFVRAVLPHGTTGMFIDPHEIANVFGLDGVRMMVDEAALQPIHVWVNVPSCVPSAPGLENAGATLGPEEIQEALSWPGVIGLGEMMNFPGVIAGDQRLHAEMQATRDAHKVIGGHYASFDLGHPFHAYLAAGPQDDHEGTRLEDAIARARQGMKVMMRLGSAWYDVEAQLPAVTELGLDPRHFLLVTDDSHSGTLVHEGHMDRVVRHAIQHGLEPMIAIQMATLNTAEHFGLGTDLGQIAPGRFADLLLVNDLQALAINSVIAKGRVAAEAGALLVEKPEFNYPEQVRNSVHLKRPLEPQDFQIPAASEKGAVLNVIGVIENQAPTRHLRMSVSARDGLYPVDLQQDLAKVALVERHRGTGQIQLGFVQGFGFDQPCAVATTVAHDSHHLLVVGTDEASMAVAANRLAEVGGGQTVVLDSEVIGLVELPIGGLMSDEPAERVAEKAEQLLAGFRRCGCQLNNANMQLSLLALVVIPELRISDLGLVDVDQFQVVPLVAQAA